MLYRGMDRVALDAAYNNTVAVGEAKRGAYVADWTKRSQAIRNAPGARLDLRYGGGPRHRLDVFRSGVSAAPTLLYIHGGYWQMNDKEPYAFLGEGVLGAGFNLALIEYTLAPQRVLPFATFMHDVGTLKNKPASWKDLFFPEIHDMSGS